MNTTFLSVIYFIGFSHALMLTIALWLRTEPGKPGKLLAIVVALLAYKLFEGGASYSGLYNYLPHALNLMPAMVMVLGPVFYAYVRQITGQKPFEWQHWLMHLAPWIAIWIFLNSPYVFRAAELKIAMWNNIASSDGGNNILPTEIVLRLLAIKAHLTTYLWLSCKGLLQFSRSVKNLRSDNSSEVLTQLRILALSFILLEAIWVSLFIAQQYFGVGTLSQVSDIWLLFIGILVLAMGFSGLQKPDMIFTQEERLIASATEPQNINEAEGNSTEKVKYIHSALADSTADEIAKLIEAAFEKQQIFLNDKLTLTDLSKDIDIKSNTVSQVINQRMQTNFYKLVNSYRVAACSQFTRR